MGLCCLACTLGMHACRVWGTYSTHLKVPELTGEVLARATIPGLLLGLLKVLVLKLLLLLRLVGPLI